MEVKYDRDAIRDALLKELELLEAEGVRSIPCNISAIENLFAKNIGGISERRTFATKLDSVAAGEAVNLDGNVPFYMAPIGSPPEVRLPAGTKRARWNYLREQVLNCPVCNAHVKLGKKVVFGVGNLDADIFLCGEAPGADEEIAGEPFVGRAGQLLTKIIEAMGIGREDVYIGNIMNWRPEMLTPHGNRPPTEEEMAFCLPYLRAQVEIVCPKVIIALGATAVCGLLGPNPKRRMCDVRGQWMTFGCTPLMITYHPSYLLRYASNESKRVVWEDFMKVMEFLNMSISEKQRAYFL
ncbi:MAG: uracil-DNA glycosylase [Puniceicoccales bacterium]|jgi:DNA polymerase|nr:uracil-DNA glycosylase [Puniceicoccales bacterium]